ncbi:MAG: InlB B-repeat-containing protein, partial [Clostridia bacterium]|nr:InlB B-repeat-containing protein [Clostridia bacterium]
LEGRDGATVVAIPDVGYEFIGWSDGVQTATRTDVDVQADMSVTANFQIIKKECAFTYIVEGNGGSIQGETKQTIVEGTYGSTVTAVPDEGYRFVGWYDDTGRWASCVSEQTSLTPYAYWWDDSTTYYARFELIEYTYTYNTTIGGRLKGERTGQDLSSIVNTVSIHNDYTSETITAVPEDGYYFVRWSDGVQSAVRQDKNVYSDLEVTAEFVHYSKFTYIVDGIGGSIAGETYQEVVDGNYGSTVTAVPDEGYRFVGWYDAAGQWAWCVSEQTSLTPYADGWYNSTTYYARFELIE